MHNATAITTGSANQRPNTPCIRLFGTRIFLCWRAKKIKVGDDAAIYRSYVTALWSAVQRGGRQYSVGCSHLDRECIDGSRDFLKRRGMGGGGCSLS